MRRLKLVLLVTLIVVLAGVASPASAAPLVGPVATLSCFTPDAGDWTSVTSGVTVGAGTVYRTVGGADWNTGVQNGPYTGDMSISMVIPSGLGEDVDLGLFDYSGFGNAPANFGVEIYTGGNQLYINRGTRSTWSVGDLITVSRSGSTVTYKKNGSTFYTDGAATSAALYPHIELRQSGDAANSIEECVDSPTPTSTGTRTITPTPINTPTFTPTDAATPTSTPVPPTATPTANVGLGGDNIMLGLSGCVVDHFTATDFSDCAYTVGDRTDDLLYEKCDFHKHIYYDLGAYYYLSTINTFFEGTNHGAGGDFQWAYYDVNLGWQDIPGAYSPEVTNDGWIASDAGSIPATRYIGIYGPNRGSSSYWCVNEVQASGDVTSAPPTWTRTSLPTGTPTPTNSATTAAIPTQTPCMFISGDPVYCDPDGNTMTPTTTSTSTRTRTTAPTQTPGGPTATPTETPEPPTPTTPPSATGCGPNTKHLYYPASIGHDTAYTIHNAGCIMVTGDTASHSGSFHCNSNSCGAFRDGPFFARGNDVQFYKYDLRCVVSIHDLSPLQGACADVEIVTRLNDLDIYWSDPQKDAPRTGTPTPTPGPGTPTAVDTASVEPTSVSGYPTQACGLTGQDPCIVQQSTPFPTVTCGQANQPPCHITLEVPTLLPGELTPVLPGLTAVATFNVPTDPVQTGTFSYLPQSYVNTGDDWIAGFSGSTYDLGCSFDIDGSDLITSLPYLQQLIPDLSKFSGRLCLNYQYVENMRIIGVDIPLALILDGVLLCVVLGTIVRRH